MQVNLTTRQLRAFLILVGEKNFTRAAAASHLSQPAFSALIRQLEDSLGIRLFERTTRMVELTSEGAEFEPAARRVLEEVGTALGVVNDRAALRRGRASIALLPSLAADWLPHVLAGFRNEHPGIEMQVADVLSEPCIDAVRSGRADFALAAIRADTTGASGRTLLQRRLSPCVPQRASVAGVASGSSKGRCGLAVHPPFAHVQCAPVSRRRHESAPVCLSSRS